MTGNVYQKRQIKLQSLLKEQNLQAVGLNPGEQRWDIPGIAGISIAATGRIALGQVDRQFITVCSAALVFQSYLEGPAGGMGPAVATTPLGTYRRHPVLSIVTAPVPG